jgi:hypothetical protein
VSVGQGVAVKQWEMTFFARTFFCESGLSEPKNRTGARVRSFDLAKEVRQMAKFARCSLHKQLQTALILSVTFI